MGKHGFATARGSIEEYAARGGEEGGGGVKGGVGEGVDDGFAEVFNNGVEAADVWG